VYYLGTDAHVYELTWSGVGWVYWDVTTSAGNAPPAAAGSAISSTVGGTAPHVYYLGTDAHVHELAWSGANWVHRDVTTSAGNAPAAAAGSAISSTVAGNVPHVYYLGTDAHVYELTWSGTNWVYRDVTTSADAE
jgi:hypothetical protein